MSFGCPGAIPLYLRNGWAKKVEFWICYRASKIKLNEHIKIGGKRGARGLKIEKTVKTP